MKIIELLNAENELMRNIAAQQPVVLSTRIRLARNLAGHPFPGRANAGQKRAVLEACHHALRTVPKLGKGGIFLVGALPNAEKALLVERHLISKELAESKGSAVYISRDQTCSVMVNEEDHLRLQVMRGGFHLKRAWKQAEQLDAALDDALHLAFSNELGYLTACPTNLGTGLRASAMLHLAGLVFSGNMDKVVRALSADGIAVRGWFGEGSDASGCIFQISNQHTLGYSETEILDRLTLWLEKIIEQEENARLRLLEYDSDKLYDQIARGLAILKNARMLTTAEAMTSLSLARLACDIGVLPQHCRALIDRLFIESQPAHIMSTAGKVLEGGARDAVRATLFRESIAKLPPPSFTVLDRNEIDELADAAKTAVLSKCRNEKRERKKEEDKEEE
ncbi:MAG: protein arginine kinase [Puniceicoccales bacterium]|jgi:protein arginine kinase|nr:protein arginine kinase [Puniceicoccales bacterium]